MPVPRGCTGREKEIVMLLRVRLSLPDRPGSLGRVARTLGVAGADIVQIVVLERQAGRAVDDFTVSWPAGASLDRLHAGLAAVGGVLVEGLWRAIGTPVVGGCDAELLGQVAANPDDGIATLVDAAPGLLAADWAAALVIPADWARRSGGVEPASPAVAYASWQAPNPLDPPPEVLPLRPRALVGRDGTRYAAAPFGRAGLVLLVARNGEGLASVDAIDPTALAGAASRRPWVAPAFHSTEVDRIAQLVRAAAGVLGDRLDLAATTEGAVAGRVS
jgi:hypothetical protein